MTAWLVDTLVATSALMLLVLALREPVRRAFGPSVAYALWLLPAARSILPTFTQTVERSVPTAPLVLPSSEFVAAAASSAPSFDWVSLAIAAWLAGAAVMLVRGLAIYLRQRRTILRDAVQLASLDGIRLVRSEHVRGPAAFGVIDRVVVVPLDFEHHFTERQRCLALEHELAHHRRGDLVANHFAFVLLCLQWFNPLAWAAHSAFRFDQEAACDARVLDKVEPAERATYGAAIARAASGRMLHFAGALDRPTTLSRRLKIMTFQSSGRARSLGFVLVGGAVLLALPLTASKAIDYLDVPAAAPVPAVPAAAAVAKVPAAPAVAAMQAGVAAPAAPSQPDPPSQLNLSTDRIIIDGETKRWEDLTPAERSRIRADIARARAEMQRGMADFSKDMARASKEMEKFRNGEFRREMDRAKADMQRALQDIDAQSAVLKAQGIDHAKIKGDLIKAMDEFNRMDVGKVVSDAMSAVDMARIQADVARAGQSLDEIDTRLSQPEGE